MINYCEYLHAYFFFQPNNRPTIKAAASFVGLGVIDSNPYIPGGGQWVKTYTLNISRFTIFLTVGFL